MKKILKIMTTTAAAAIIAAMFGLTAHAGGGHFSLNVALPLPPLPPIPTPFGFVDVNPPATYLHFDAPTVYVPAYRRAPVYRHAYWPAYRTTYSRHYVRYYDYDRHDRPHYNRHVHNDRHHNRNTYRDRYYDRDYGRGGWRR